MIYDTSYKTEWAKAESREHSRLMRQNTARNLTRDVNQLRGMIVSRGLELWQEDGSTKPVEPQQALTLCQWPGLPEGHKHAGELYGFWKWAMRKTRMKHSRRVKQPVRLSQRLYDGIRAAQAGNMWKFRALFPLRKTKFKPRERRAIHQSGSRQEAWGRPVGDGNYYIKNAHTKYG